MTVAAIKMTFIVYVLSGKKTLVSVKARRSKGRV